ncbi:MAG: penicillin-binding protein 1B [Pseudomonadales bacterium]|nr:penicillin-binding protein 1B [Pseudomonadales bacterium]
MRRLLMLWRHPLVLKLGLLLLVLLASYTVYLDATIRSSFDGKKWQVPARVYARPLELFEGMPLTPQELASELRDLGYSELRATSPGSFQRNGNRLSLYSRGFDFWDGSEPQQIADVEFRNGSISRLARMGSRGASGKLALLRLEPLEIGAIYPAHKEDRVLVRLEEVPPLLTAALLAIEDHRFYQHHGVSLVSIARAALANAKSGAVVQGGSTLTQQLVKNFYLDRSRTLRRKVTEALMSGLLELHYSKEAILEAYLNEVYLGQAGARAIHGFGLASQHYFNRALQELSIEKLALLVAIVRGPAYYDPWRHPDRALARRNRVIDALVGQELLAAEDAQWAKAQPLNLGKASRSHFTFPAYMDLVKRQLGETYKREDLTSNGLRVFTSFDPRVQRRAEQAVRAQIAKLQSRVDKQTPAGDLPAENFHAKQVRTGQKAALQAAVVVTQTTTAEVLAVVGGSDPRFAGYNRALDARRSIGSVVKPFVYLTALERGDYTLASLIDDAPIAFNNRDGSEWVPRNFDRKDHGQVPLITALAKSYNQATARLGQQLGLDAVVETLRRAGQARELNAVPSLFIGTTQLTPYEVTTLYQTIAANGFRTPLKAIRSVLDSDGKPLQRFPYQTEQVIDPHANYLLQRALVAVGEFGSAVAASHKLGAASFAGKTGTSGAQRDSWFAGFRADLLAVAWVGYDDNKTMPFTGASAALPLWVELMASASRQPVWLLPPAGIEQHWVNTLSGMPTRRGCENSLLLPFVQGSAPQGARVCDSPQALKR